MPDQSKEILHEARGARQTSEKLLPLLDLLADQEVEASPLDELKGLLQAILQILGHQQKALQRIESARATALPHAH